jgi:trimeric autotransporter adhesin
MSITSIASTATQALTSTSSASSTAKAPRSRSSMPPAKDAASVSGPAQTMNKLQALQKSDPAKFKEVMSTISDKLSSAAQSSTSPAEQKALTDAAARFKSAGDSGDLSALAPQKGAGAGRAKRGSGAPPAGGPKGPPAAKPAPQASASAAVTSPADTNADGKVSAAEQAAYDAKQAAESAASSGAQRAYGHGHGGGGAFAQVGSIVDSVLSGVAAAAG